MLSTPPPRTNSCTYLGQTKLHFDLEDLISSILSHSLPFYSSQNYFCSFLTPARHSRAFKGSGELEPSISSTSSLGCLPTHLPPLPLTVLSPPAARASLLNNHNYCPLRTFHHHPLWLEKTLTPHHGLWGLQTWYLLLSLPHGLSPQLFKWMSFRMSVRMSPSQGDFPHLKQLVTFHPFFNHFLYHFIFKYLLSHMKGCLFYWVIRFLPVLFCSLTAPQEKGSRLSLGPTKYLSQRKHTCWSNSVWLQVN